MWVDEMARMSEVTSDVRITRMSITLPDGREVPCHPASGSGDWVLFFGPDQPVTVVSGETFTITMRVAEGPDPDVPD